MLKNYNKESDLRGSSRRPAVRRLEPQPGPSATRDNTSRLDNTMDNSLYFVKPDLSASGNTNFGNKKFCEFGLKFSQTLELA